MRTALLLALGVFVSVNSYAQAPTRVDQHAVIFIEASDFGQALSAAILKKKVPVIVTTSRERASFFVEESSKLEKEGAAERVTKVLALGAFAGSGRTYEASVTLANVEGTVVFAHNARKGDIRRAAEEFASKLKDQMKKQR